MKDTQLADIFSEVLEGLNDASNTDIFKNSIDSLKGLQKQVENTNKRMTELARNNNLRGVKQLKQSADRVRQSQVEAAEELMKAKEALLQIDQESNQKAYAAQIKNIKRINQNISQLAKETAQLQKNAGNFSEGLEHNFTQYENLLRSREERIAELGKAGAIMEEKFAKRFESSVDVFTSGIGDLESFGKAFQSSLGSFSGYLSERAGKAKEKADEGKGSAEVANMLGGLSKTMGIVAVAAGSIMALISLFKMAEESVIGANKKLVESSGLIDMMAVGTGSTAKNLELVRDTFREADFATEMGMALEDTIDLVNEFQQLNLGIKQFGGGVEGMEKMKEAMKSAKGMSMALGISMSESSQYMSKFAHDLGVAVHDGSILGKMADDFANIRDMALQSSYSTANFFKKVMELTDQLENMNYRTKEAGILMVRFTKVLGKSGLDKALQSLFSGFRGEGYLDQLKRNMLTKSEELRKATQVEALRFAQTFSDSFGGKKGTSDAFKSLGKALGGKIATVKGEDGKERVDEKALVARLAKLSEKERQKVMSDLGPNVSGEFKNELFKFMRLAAGTKKNATAAERQAAQEEFGATGNLKSKFAIMESVVGDKDVNNLGVITKEMLGQFGIGKEQLDVFAQLQTTMKGDMRKAQDMAKGKIDMDEDFLASKGLKMKDGKLVMAETEMAVTNFSDYLQAQGEKLDELLPKAEEKKTQEQYLDEGVKATTSVFDALNNTIAGILNDISKGIYNLVGWFFGGGLDSEDKEEQQKALRTLEGEMATLESNKAERASAIDKQNKLVGKLALKPGAKRTKEDEEKLAAAQAELARLQEKQAQEEVKLQRTKDMHRDLTLNAANFDEISSAFDTTETEFLEEARERALKGERKKGRERGNLKKFKQEQDADLAGMTDMQGNQIKSYDELRQVAMSGHLTDKTAQLMLERGIKLEDKLGLSRLSKTVKGADGKPKDEMLSQVVGVTAGMKKKTTKSEEVMAQALEDLKKPTPMGEARKRAIEDQKARKKENIDQQVEAMKKYQSQVKEQELKDIARTLQIKSTDAGAIGKRFQAVSGDEKYLGRLRRLAIGGNESAKRLLGFAGSSDGVSASGTETPDGTKKPSKTKTKGPVVKKVKAKSRTQKDFWIDSKGNLWKIDPADLPTPMGGGLAMTRPGDAVESYVDERFKKMGNVGGGVNITVNVNGGFTNEQTGMVVATAVSDTMKDFMGGVG